MKTNVKKVLCLVLSVVMVAAVALTGCNTDTGKTDPTAAPEYDTASYTYQGYSSALGNNWNPHTWETNADDLIQSYISSPLCDLSISDSENGVYQWVFEMATSIEDVTKDHQDDLTKYAVSLPEGKSASDITEGYVYEIKLNQDAMWQNGTKITADDYVYSMQAMLDPAMQNYRANNYWSGESAIAGALAYYNSGSQVHSDNGAMGTYATAAAVTANKDADGNYVTEAGLPMYIATGYALDWLGGETLSTYVGAYGADYFDVDAFTELDALKNDEGLVVANEASIALLYKVLSVPAWGETGEDAIINYIVYDVKYDVVDYSVVGLYKVDDYTIRYVTEAYLDRNYFLTSCTSNWLVYKDLYEAGKDTTGELVTTNYGTSADTSMSYGVYKIESFQEDKQIVFVQNENWYGWDKTAKEAGAFISYTNFDVDGAKQRQYMTSKIVIDVMTDDAAKLLFLSGKIDEWVPSADELPTYSTSDQLYQVDETYTMSLFFHSNLEDLKAMDTSYGNTNSVVLSNENFRKAFSLSIDRAEWVTATAGYKPAYYILNSLYFYDVYNDPTSSYRNSDEAMQAIVNLYGVEYGDGKTYATLKEAYQSINGYNLTEAKALMKTACDELVAEGVYKAGDPIVIRIGYKKGSFDSTDNQQIALLNKYINAAVEGSGFGTVTLEGVDNIPDRYGSTAKGEFAIGYGAWGGAAFYPFTMFRVYMDPSYVDPIHESGCWDPSTEKWTLKVNGEDVTMTCQDWSVSMTGTGAYANADFSVKLSILAQLEEMYLGKYYRIPLATSTSCSMLSYKVAYYTENYNIMYGFGGMRLMKYNYNDTEWAAYLAENNNTLSYE